MSQDNELRGKVVIDGLPQTIDGLVRVDAAWQKTANSFVQSAAELKRAQSEQALATGILREAQAALVPSTIALRTAQAGVAAETQTLRAAQAQATLATVAQRTAATASATALGAERLATQQVRTESAAFALAARQQAQAEKEAQAQTKAHAATMKELGTSVKSLVGDIKTAAGDFGKLGTSAASAAHAALSLAGGVKDLAAHAATSAAGVVNLGHAAEQASGGFTILKGTIASTMGALSAQVISGATGALKNGVSIGIKSAMDLGQAVANISTIADVNTQKLTTDLNAMSGRVPETAAQLAASFYNVESSIDQASNGGQAGLEKITELLAKGADAASTDADTWATAMLGLKNAYNQSFDGMQHSSDVMFKTIQYGVVNGAQLAAGLGELTSSAKVAGLSVDELGASIAAETRQGGDAGQNLNNLNNLLTKFTTKGTQDELHNMGVATLDAKGNFLPFMDVLTQAKGKLDKLTPSARALELQALFPDLQARTGLTTLLDQLDSAKGFLKENQTAAGTTEAAYAKMSQTASAQWTLFKNNIKAGASTVGASVLGVLTPELVKLNGALSENAPKIQKFADTVGRDITYALGTARDSVITFKKAFDGNWKDASSIRPIHRVIGDIGDIARTAYDSVTTFTEAFNGHWKDASTIRPLHRAIGDLGLGFRTLDKDAHQALGRMGLDLVTLSDQGHFGTATPLVRDFGNAVSNLAAGNKTKGVKELGTTFRDAGNLIKIAWDKVKPIAQDALTITQNLNPLKLAFDALHGAAEGGKDGAFAALATDLGKVETAGIDLAGKLADQFGLKGLKDALPGLKDDLDNAGKALGDILKDPNVAKLPGTLLDMAGALAGSVGPALKDAQPLISAAAGALGGIADFVKSNPKEVLEAVGVAFVAWKTAGLAKTAIDIGKTAVSIGKVGIEAGTAAIKLGAFVAVKMIDFLSGMGTNATSAAAGLKSVGDEAATATGKLTALDAAKAGGAGAGVASGATGVLGTLGAAATVVAPIAAIGLAGNALQDQSKQDGAAEVDKRAQAYADAEQRKVTATDKANAAIIMSNINEVTQAAGMAGREGIVNDQLAKVRTDTAQHALDDLNKIKAGLEALPYSGKQMADAMTGNLGLTSAEFTKLKTSVETGGVSIQNALNNFGIVSTEKNAEVAAAVKADGFTITGSLGATDAAYASSAGAAQKSATDSNAALTGLASTALLVSGQVTQSGKDSADGFRGVDWTGAGNSASTGLATGFQNGVGVVITTSQGAAQQTQSAFKIGGWSDIGADIDRGIAAGIAGSEGTISAAALAAVEGVVGSTRAHMQIYSPSRRTRDMIGVPMGQGVGVGMAQGLAASTLGIVAAIGDSLSAAKQKAISEAADLMSKVNSALTGGVSASAAVGTFVAPDAAKTKGVGSWLSGVEAMFAGMAKGADPKTLTAIGNYADTLNKITAPITSAVTAIAAIATSKKVSEGQIANVFNPLILMAQKARDAAKIVGDLTAAGMAGDNLGKIIAPLKDAADVLASFTTFKGVSEQQIANVMNPLILVAEKARDSEKVVTSAGAASAGAYGENLSKIIAPLKDAQTVLTGLVDLPTVSAGQIANLTNPIILIAEKERDSAKIVGDLTEAANFGEAVGKIVAPLQTAETVITNLPTIPDVSGDMINRVVRPVMALAQAMKAGAVLIGTEGVAQAGALGEAIGKMTGGMSSALSLLTTLGAAEGTPGTPATYASRSSGKYHKGHLGRVQTSAGTPGVSFEDMLKNAAARVPALVSAVEDTIKAWDTGIGQMVSDLGGGDSKKGNTLLTAAAGYTEQVSKVTGGIDSIVKTYEDVSQPGTIKAVDKGIAMMSTIVQKIIAGSQQLTGQMMGGLGVMQSFAATGQQFENAFAVGSSAIRGTSAPAALTPVAPSLVSMPGGKASNAGGSNGGVNIVFNIPAAPSPFPGYVLIKTEDLQKLQAANGPQATSNWIGGKSLTLQSMSGKIGSLAS